MAWVLQHEVRTDQSARGVGGLPFDIAVVGAEGGTHALEATQVDVDGPRSEVVAAWHRDLGSSAARQERAEDHDRSAHLLHQLGGGLRDDLVGGWHRDHEA